jgi:hypothetical protein
LENVGAFQKYWGIWKILAHSRNIGGFGKNWRFPDILADLENVGVLQKYRRMIESWRALKSPRLVKYQRIWKKLAARLLFGFGGISNC